MSEKLLLNGFFDRIGMEQLRTAAPSLMGTFGVPPPPAGFPAANAATTTAPSDTNTNTTTTAPSAQANPALFSEFMARMMNGNTFYT